MKELNINNDYDDDEHVYIYIWARFYLINLSFFFVSSISFYFSFALIKFQQKIKTRHKQFMQTKMVLYA